MKLNAFQQQALTDQRSHIEKYGTKTWMWTIFYLLWIGLGGYALYLQIVDGHEVTGMRDHVVWGLYIANFIFFQNFSRFYDTITSTYHVIYNKSISIF